MTSSSRSKSTILYADDDSDDLQLVSDAFLSYKANVDIINFSNGARLLNYIRNLEDNSLPCLIILDINMPILNGKECLVKLREDSRFAAIPVILFTTSSQPRDIEFALSYNASMITKPIHDNQMIKIADIFLQHCGAGVRESIQNI
jgi:CheY-like chemotaxis protein